VVVVGDVQSRQATKQAKEGTATAVDISASQRKLDQGAAGRKRRLLLVGACKAVDEEGEAKRDSRGGRFRQSPPVVRIRSFDVCVGNWVESDLVSPTVRQSHKNQ
jgi:hypothetical protein